jgi:hypothetical protein
MLAEWGETNMPKFPRPHVILRQVEELPVKDAKGELVYLKIDKHPYIYQHEG